MEAIGQTYRHPGKPLFEGCEPRQTGIYLVIGSSAVAALLALLTNANPWLIPATCVCGAYLYIMVRRLEFGIYLLLATAIAFDQFIVWHIDSWYTATTVHFFQNLNNMANPVVTDFQRFHELTAWIIGKLLLNPVELILLLMIGIWLIRAVAARGYKIHPIPNLGVSLVFLAMVTSFTAYGVTRPNGDLKVALWEVRPLYYLCATYLLATQAIRKPHHVRTCVWIIIIGLAFRALQGCWRFFVTLERDLTGLRAIMGHEDSVFLATGLILLAAFLFLQHYGAEFYVLLCTAIPSVLTILLNQRRVAYGMLGVCLIILVCLLPRRQFMRSLRFVIPGALLVVIYLAAFWNASGLKAMPAQKVKSVFVAEPDSADASSNQWREAELYNLKITVRVHPFGIGFGQKFLQYVPYADIGSVFPLWDYIPHCAIYWIWVKTGIVGFTIFWLFFGVVITQTMIDYRAMKTPYYKALALMVMLFIAGQLMVAYYDLQISFYRNMIYLGIAMGIGAVIRNMDSQVPENAGGPNGQDAKSLT